MCSKVVKRGARVSESKYMLLKEYDILRPGDEVWHPERQEWSIITPQAHGKVIGVLWTKYGYDWQYRRESTEEGPGGLKHCPHCNGSL